MDGVNVREGVRVRVGIGVGKVMFVTRALLTRINRIKAAMPIVTIERVLNRRGAALATSSGMVGASPVNRLRAIRAFWLFALMLNTRRSYSIRSVGSSSPAASPSQTCPTSRNALEADTRLVYTTPT